MIASASSADPLDHFDVVLDRDAEPLDLDGFLDALDQIVTRRLQQRYQSEAGDPAKVAHFSDSTPPDRASQEVKRCRNQV